MFKSILKIAIRNLKKYKIFTLVNISGLTLGITAVLLIMMYVFTEISFEGIHKNRNCIYRVNTQIGIGDRPFKLTSVIPVLGPAAKSAIPEVKDYVRFWPGGKLKLNIGKMQFDEPDFYYADPSIFKVFTFELIKGNIRKPFQNSNSVVITQSLAEKIFGNKNPIGQIIQTNIKDFYVSAVASNIPENTHLKWSIIAPIENLEKSDPNYLSWTSGGSFTYLLLKENSSIPAVEKKLNQLVKKNGPAQMAEMVKYYTQKLTDIYLYSDIEFDNSPKGNITLVYLLSAVAAIILIIAVFNFVNLSTVRSIQRSKEVGLKKVLGAKRSNLISQFLCESFIITLGATIISFGLFQILNPYLSKFLEYRLNQPDYMKVYFYLGVLVIYIIVAVLSGIYPAIYLSRNKPVEIIKGTFQSVTGRFTLRKSIVIFQFALSIILISGTIVVIKQFSYMKNADIGIDKSNLILTDYPYYVEGNENKCQVLKNKLLNNADVADVIRFYTFPGIKSEIQEPISFTKNNQKSSMMINRIGVDYDFIPMMKAKLLSGRNFSREYLTDSSSSVIINQSAAKMLGLKNPVGTVVQIGGIGPIREVKIIGVVKDFHLESLHNKIVPYVLYVNPSSPMYLAIKIKNPQKTIPFVKSVWEEIFPGLNFNYSFYEDNYIALYSNEKKLADLFTIFALLAIFIACLGLLGLSSFTTLIRTKEIGIRKVLGSNIPAIILMLSKDYVKWVAIAFIVAIPAEYYIINLWLQNFAYRIEISWWIFTLSGGVALVIALATVSFQAVKAATANPIESLKYE